MNFKKILASVAACAVAVSAMTVAASAATFEGSHKMVDESWWTQDKIVDFESGLTDLTVLIGDLDPASVTSITFTGDTAFFVGYNGTDGTWHQNSDAVTSLTLTDVLLVEDGDKGPALHIMISKGDGVEYTINWVAEAADDAEESSEEETSAPEETTVEETAAPEETTAEETAAPEETTAAESTTPADNGDTDAPTADKNTPDTGVEGVAVAAALAIVTAGAVMIAKKRS